MPKKDKELATVADEQSLAMLRQTYPSDPGFTRKFYPRLGFFSQDKFEGKGKAAKLVQEAGIFYKEIQTDELDENGKKKWEKEEIGNSLEGIILYQRKQLKYFDGEAYTSSTVFDENDETVLLFKNKVQVDKGTPAELKSREIYQGKSAKGKDVSKLEDNRLLYVLYEGEVYQLNLRGSSMYAFLTYARKQSPNTVVRVITSEAKENGSIAWNQMVFSVKRTINQEELGLILENTAEIKGSIEEEKGFFAAKGDAEGTVSVLSELEKRELKNF